MAQVPVDDDGNVIGDYQSQAEIMPIGEGGIPRLSQTDLQELVGPIALYPDDLLAIVLPASAYPLQVVEAARFLEALESDPTLQPDADWDDSIVALINYPEVVALLNDDLDWTWRLGEAVVAQQTDVIAAVESFRDRAYAAGNLKSDEYQTVANDEGVIRISPAADDVIYVPYYEPERVVYYQPRPVYYYYPRPYPVYYYPYASNHYFDRGFFWGVTTAFSIGWYTDSLHVYHHSYRGHPYYGRTYWNDGWYRRPSINVYNTTYVRNTNVSVNSHSNGDRWRARDSRREYVRREGYARPESGNSHRGATVDKRNEPIAFRERDARTVGTQTLGHDAQRQQSVSSSRDNQRQGAAIRPRDSRSESVSSTRTTSQRNAVARTPQTSHDIRRNEPTVRTQDINRQSTSSRSQRSASYRPEPTRQSRTQAPTRSTVRTPTTVRSPSPAPRERRQSEARTREQPSRSRESSSQAPRSSPSKSNSSERRSNQSRPRSRED
jgi:hypothetical protein